jgi:hypothetical protein
LMVKPTEVSNRIVDVTPTFRTARGACFLLLERRPHATQEQLHG